LRWPPPGLERMQGDLFAIAGRAALAGGLLALPLLFVVAREQDFATLGPFADAWWVSAILASVGLTFTLDALIRSARTMRRAARALGSGYDITTVAHVLADSSRDMGFLLQGARHFSVMDAREREAIASIRVTAAVLMAAAGLWLTLAVTIGLFFAARGLISPSGLQMVTLLPALLAYAGGGVATVVQDGRVRSARRAWHHQPWSADLASDEIQRWRADRAHLEIATGSATHEGLTRVLGRAPIVVWALALVVAAAVLTLVSASTVGPILTTVSMPTIDNYGPRAARAEAFRSYVTGGDVTITATEAGQILQDLIYVGTDHEPSAGERPPSRRIAQPRVPNFGDVSNPMGLKPFAWGDSLIERVAAGVTSEQRDYLADVAAHPASADFSRLARATALDAGSARWATPFPEGMTMATVPLPRFTPLRSSANAHVAAAAYELVEGRADRAERLLSEVISVGFLLGDQGPTLIDNLVGYALVEAGGAALEDLYRVTGQTGAASELSRLGEVAERSARLIPVDRSEGSEAWVRSLPAMVLDTTLMRGLRWEYFIEIATVAPCLNMQRMVFGADESYGVFIDQARESLVRWPSDEAVFEIAKYGWIGAREPANPTLFGRVAALFMSTGEYSCGAFVRHVEAGELFQ
jgi:hypothetical protein